jgi:O-antigen ligase
MWILAAMPSLALCLRKEHLKPYCICFGAIITLYALGLGAQLVLNTETTAYNYPGRHAWPLLDPNNAAAVINLALVPCVWLALFKDLRWSVLCLVFAFALCATGSKAGFAAAGLATLILLTARLGTEFLIFASFIGALFAGAIFFYRPEFILIVLDSFRDRFPIWDASLPLAFLHPFVGIGLGAFGHYYERVRTEQYTVGWHCHNDVLQFAIEMGIPAALTFCVMLVTAARAACRANLAAACALLAIVLQSTVEFQFYIPAVSLPMGLALGFLLLNQPRKAAL